MALGRPTDYRPEMAELLTEHMLQGGSIIGFCRRQRICKQTFHNWKEKHPAFMDAYTQGLLDSESWWEEQGQMNLCNHKFNAALYKFMMVNKFKENWSDKKDVQQSTEISIAEPTQRKIREVMTDEPAVIK